jgi:hypothetical protein
MKSADKGSSINESRQAEGAAPRSAPAASKRNEKTLARLQQDKHKLEQDLIEARARLQEKAHELKERMGKYEENTKRVLTNCFFGSFCRQNLFALLTYFKYA